MVIFDPKILQNGGPVAKLYFNSIEVMRVWGGCFSKRLFWWHKSKSLKEL